MSKGIEAEEQSSQQPDDEPEDAPQSAVSDAGEEEYEKDQEYDKEADDDEEPEDEEPPQWPVIRYLPMVFACWSPAQLSLNVPPEVPLIAAFFRTLERFTDFPLLQTVWQPDAETLEEIEFFVQHQDTAELRDVLLHSAGLATDLITDWGVEPTPPPPARPQNFLAAWARLQASARPAMDEPLEPHERQEIWSDFEQQLDREVIQPLVAEAMEHPDPRQRTMRLMGAKVSRVFHLQAAVILQEFSAIIGEPGTSNATSFPHQNLNSLLAVAKTVVLLSREIQ